MKKTIPAPGSPLHRATTYITRYIDKEVACAEKIVSFRTLARRAEVSVFTISKVISKLIETGILQKVENEGIFKGPLPEKKTTSQKNDIKHYSIKWERVKARIAHDILIGNYDNKILTSSELITQYGVTFSTIKKSLRALIADGLIVETKAGFKVIDSSRSPYSATLIMISAGSRDGILGYSNEMEFEISRTVESECLQSEINVKLVIFDGSVGDVLWTIESITKNCSVIGFIISGFHIDHTKFDSLVRKVLATGLPTAAIALEDQDAYSSDIPPKVRFGAFTIENKLQPGRKAGRFLLQSGHKKILYFDAHPDDTWSHCRLQGLHEIITGVSEHFSVIHVPLKDIAQRSRDYCDTTLPLQQIILSADKYRIQKNSITCFMQRYSNHQQILDSLESYENLLNHKDITAWVGDTDTTALAIVDHLKFLGIAIPHNIAVMGFNNSHEAQTFNLTSFDFNAAAAARGMVKFIINPAAFPQWPEKIFIEGTIIKRSTT